jgi:anti-anti-sigma factor
MKIPKDMIIADLVRDYVVIHFRPTHLREQGDVERVVSEIQDVIRDHEFRIMVLNFSRVRLLTSSFLGKLMVLHRQLKAANVKLRACAMGPPVRQGFTICKLQKLIPVFDTEAEALA